MKINASSKYFNFSTENNCIKAFQKEKDWSSAIYQGTSTFFYNLVAVPCERLLNRVIDLKEFLGSISGLTISRDLFSKTLGSPKDHQKDASTKTAIIDDPSLPRETNRQLSSIDTERTDQKKMKNLEEENQYLKETIENLQKQPTIASSQDLINENKDLEKIVSNLSKKINELEKEIVILKQSNEHFKQENAQLNEDKMRILREKFRIQAENQKLKNEELKKSLKSMKIIHKKINS